MTDKIIVTNFSALTDKYGTGGLNRITATAKVLIAADKTRGLTTQLVDISDKAVMKKFNGAPVTTGQSGRQNKAAIDAIYASAKPDYIVILDCDDVVPHIDLNNPTPNDGDPTVPSDLPYASDAGFSDRNVATYAAVTRVVGRIAGIMAAKTPDFLIGQLTAAANFKTRTHDDYLPHFGISADEWKKSTALSVDNIFGSDAIDLCPPTGTPGVSAELAPRAHFINCHGGSADPQFYGQNGEDYPVALTSADVTAGAKPDTVIAAECCYGAQLFDPTLADGALPISNAYLAAGAVGFLGSTTLAYGPSAGNGAADLITQYFLINILAGASLGRACLQARQKFMQSQKMSSPVNLKTLGQFILLADPSLQPCPLAQPAPADAADEAVAHVVDHAMERKRRRVALMAFGHAVAASSTYPGKRITRLAPGLHRRARDLARQRGFGDGHKIMVYHVAGGVEYRKAMKSRSLESKVLVLTEQPERTQHTRHPESIKPTHVLVAHAQDGRIVDIAEYISR